MEQHRRFGTAIHDRRGNRGVSGTGGKLHPALDASSPGLGAEVTVDACAGIAWRGELPLEPAPELYLERTVEIFRQVHRVLRKDGTASSVVGAQGSVAGEY